MAKELSVDLVVFFDLYGALLSDRQREVFDYYYNDDLSLAEISENLSITRQGVLENIKKAEAKLRVAEQKLGFAKRFSDIDKKVSEIRRAAGSIKSAEGDQNSHADKILGLCSQIFEF